MLHSQVAFQGTCACTHFGMQSVHDGVFYIHPDIIAEQPFCLNMYRSYGNWHTLVPKWYVRLSWSSGKFAPVIVRVAALASSDCAHVCVHNLRTCCDCCSCAHRCCDCFVRHCCAGHLCELGLQTRDPLLPQNPWKSWITTITGYVVTGETQMLKGSEPHVGEPGFFF